MAASVAVDPSLPPKPAHPLRDAMFRKWWIGASISLVGDQFYLVALPWVILQLTGSAVAMGTIMMLAAVPRAVLMLLGGVVIINGISGGDSAARRLQFPRPLSSRLSISSKKRGRKLCAVNRKQASSPTTRSLPA